jgi:hypothetical protein
MGEFMRIMIPAMLLLGLTACQETAGPPPAPEYPAPNYHIAQRAYETALRFDGYDNLAGESRAERMSAFRYQLEVQEARRERTREDTLVALDALRRVDLAGCTWRGVSEDELPDWARERLQTAPPAAYECDFTLYFQRSGPPPGPRLTESATGLFFMREGEWMYMGRMPNPYN